MSQDVTENVTGIVTGCHRTCDNIVTESSQDVTEIVTESSQVVTGCHSRHNYMIT